MFHHQAGIVTLVLFGPCLTMLESSGELQAFLVPYGAVFSSSLIWEEQVPASVFLSRGCHTALHKYNIH